MGREKRARLKRWSKNTRRTCRCSHHQEASYPGKSKNTTTNNGCNTYYYDKRIGMIIWMHAWHGNFDAMQLIKFKRNQNPDTHIYGSSCFTTRQFKYWLAWQRQDIGYLHTIKWSGVTIFGNTQVLHMLCIRWYANYHVATWCEMQTLIWMTYSVSTHFSDKLSYKICFVLSYSLKDIVLARFDNCRNFQKTVNWRLKLGRTWTWRHRIGVIACQRLTEEFLMGRGPFGIGTEQQKE
jgi:hypothetical protein